MRSESFSRPWNQSSSRRSSRFTLRNLFGHRGSSTSAPQLPPLNFGGEEDTFWPTSQIISPEPSSPVSEQSSLYSPRRSVVSRDSVYTSVSQGSAALRAPRPRSQWSSLLSAVGSFEPPSPPGVALTTRVSMWKSAGQPRVITKTTIEGLIHYLSQTSDGEHD